jgi:hypothetical protein
MEMIVDAFDAIPEPVDAWVEAGVVPREEDLKNTEIVELGLKHVDDMEEAGEESEEHEAEMLKESGSVLDTNGTKRMVLRTTPYPLEDGKRVVRYCRGAELTDRAWEEFKNAHEEVSKQCDTLDFQEVSESECKLQVKGDTSGCSAHVGYGDGIRNLTLKDSATWIEGIFEGTCATKGIAIHELLHALGQYHEQSRPDRDTYIHYYPDQVKEGKQHNFDEESAESTKVGYTIESLMHYGCGSFPKNWPYNTLRMKNIPWWWTPYYDCTIMGQRGGMHSDDIQQLRNMYECKAKESSRRRRKWFWR